MKKGREYKIGGQSGNPNFPNATFGSRLSSVTYRWGRETGLMGCNREDVTTWGMATGGPPPRRPMAPEGVALG